MTSETMLQQRLLAALQAPEPRPWEPDFQVDRDADGWWIRDGGRSVGFIHSQQFNYDPIAVSPWRALVDDPIVSPRYDMGSRFGGHLALLTNVRGNFVPPPDGPTMTWVETGARLQLQVDQDWGPDCWCRNTLHLGYDPHRAAYTVRIEAETHETDPPPRREFCNLYAQGMGNGIDTRRRWQYTVWQGHDGRLWKLPHNPSLTYGVRPGNTLYKRFAPGGFIGFGTEADYNPTVLFHDANGPLLSGTCDMWFDEHLSCGLPGIETRRGGRTVARAAIEWVDLPAAAMAELVDAAQVIPLDDDEVRERACPALLWARENRLDQALDPTVPGTGYVFVPGDDRWVEVGPEDEDPVDEYRGAEGGGDLARWWREGEACLRLIGLAGKRVAWLAAGQAPHVEPGKRYRFAAYVRTEDGARAGLRLVNDWHKVYDTAVVGTAGPVRAPEWQRLEIEIETTDYPFLACWLEVYGPGPASFRDLWFGPA